MRILDFANQGGFIVWPLMLLSVLALAVFVRKVLDLRSARAGMQALLDACGEFIALGDNGGITRCCEGSRTPLARVMAATAGALVTNPRRAEAEAARIGALELERLDANVSLLAFVAQVAPLMGLLGTVLGMVDLFAGIRGSGVDPALLASGIWKALLTTAGGLLVAIPALAGHAWLSSRIEEFRRRLADASQRILNSAGIALKTEEGNV